MAKQTSIEILKSLTSYELSQMPREEKIKLLASGTKANYERMKSIKEKGIYSYYISKKEVAGEKIQGRILKKTAEKMTNTELDKALWKASNIAKAKTTYVRGAKSFSKKFAGRTGKSPSDVDSQTWDKLRKSMEKYGSEEVFIAYSIYGDDVDEVLEAREQAEAQGAYERQKILDEMDELPF